MKLTGYARRAWSLCGIRIGWSRKLRFFILSQVLLAERRNQQAQELLLQARDQIQSLSAADLACIDAAVTSISASVVHQRYQKGVA